MKPLGQTAEYLPTRFFPPRTGCSLIQYLTASACLDAEECNWVSAGIRDQNIRAQPILLPILLTSAQCHHTQARRMRVDG
ncbi:hypothetical protein CEXT_701671 [Caerostris extrusa]|uniref:Uncharacterized protein n=1 Tax=Caerostris extrusa TaxID=172846 RepID=A0AAV4X1D4_CAEEX|nr:hypothetical protein CEXT_701671 [Caerostris extrusa]